MVRIVSGTKRPGICSPTSLAYSRVRTSVGMLHVLWWCMQSVKIILVLHNYVGAVSEIFVNSILLSVSMMRMQVIVMLFQRQW